MPAHIARSLFILAIFAWADSHASFCPAPDLDRAYEVADYVLIAQLDSARVVDQWTAEGEFHLQEELKGYPPAAIPFRINFNTQLECGIDLIFGKAYLVFAKKEDTAIVILPGTSVIYGQSPMLDWVMKRMQPATTP